MAGFGLCDRNSFAGVVRGLVAFREIAAEFPGFRYLVGTRLVFSDGTPDIVAYPTDRNAYGRLCKLLTIGNLAGEKGDCRLGFNDVPAYAEGQLFILMPDEADWTRTETTLKDLRAMAPGGVWLGAAPRFDGTDRARLNRLAALAQRAGVPLLATGDVLYHAPERRVLQDVLTCIREHISIFEAGRRLEKHAERHLKPPAEMRRLFREHPEAIAETRRFAARITFTLDDLRYNYPLETVGNGETAQETLERLTWEGAAKRYPGGLTDKIRRTLWEELCLIAYKRYAAYFLTVRDIVQFARHKRKILCQGRGSAANSAVCFCLEITEVDPTIGTLVFGRFISTERDEPPDIDVDFEHERREEVIQYLYGKYGRERTGLTANVITYRTKAALREVGKVFGLSDDTIGALNQLHWGWADGIQPETLKEIGLDPAEPILASVLEVARALRGFPRHLSQHVGGFVITKDPLDHLIPIGKSAMDGRTIVEWNKDDIDALGILKVDVLALGMLSALRRAFEMMHRHYRKDYTIAGLVRDADKNPEQAEPVFRMTQRADTIGVFQIESRAQMTMLPRLKPQVLYDFVIEVAIVRPGPIQGGMVHPYLQRRISGEKVTFPKPELEAVLERTLGVPLFQEQAMQIAIVAAGFTPGEADQLRRAMATFKRNGRIETFRARMIGGMLAKGYQRDFAEACFRQIEGFGEYGFPESHAASFALLVWASAFIKCHYPDVFCAAMLNSQPMGFYAPAQLIRDAREHGVEIRGVDINLSDHDCVLEDGSPAAERVWVQHREMAGDIRSTHAVRLGLRYVKGLAEGEAMKLLARRGRGYDSVRDLWLRTGLTQRSLELLAEADAFSSLGLDRRDALWAVRGLLGTHGAETLPLFQSAGPPSRQDEPDARLPPMPPGESVIHDYRTLSFSLKGHPVQFIRDKLTRKRILRCSDLLTVPDGRTVEVAGLVLVRQRPGTASGVIFATIEDETGIANLIIWPKVFEANRRVVLGARMIAVRGQLQSAEGVTHLVTKSFTDMTADLLEIANGAGFGDAAMAHADEGKSGPYGSRSTAKDSDDERRQRHLARQALPQGRNFQ
jgi:error-prone DNA polymerase